MALEFGAAVRALEEHIEILKQELLFAMAQHKPENRGRIMTHKVITIKRELDKAVQERMQLKQIYHQNSTYI
jgi:hypothetical protein